MNLNRRPAAQHVTGREQPLIQEAHGLISCPEAAVTATRQNIQKDGCNKELFSFTEKPHVLPSCRVGL